MAYDQLLADRVRSVLDDKRVSYYDKKMMGGLCFMVDEKMCLGIVKDHLMARIGEEAYSEAIKKDGAREMDFTGRPMKGYVFVDPEGVDFEEDLEYFVDLALQFNPLAKKSKKRQKK